MTLSRFNDSQHDGEMDAVTAGWTHFFAKRWSHIGTFTTDYRDEGGRLRHRYVTPDRLKAEWRDAHREIERIAQRPVAFACVLDHVAGDHLHLHTFLDCAGVTCRNIRKTWKGGMINDVRLYRPEQYAANRGYHAYLGRKVARDSDALWLWGTLPPDLHPTADDTNSPSSSTGEDMLELVRNPKLQSRLEARPVAVSRIPCLAPMPVSKFDRFASHWLNVLMKRAGVSLSTEAAA